MAHANSKRPKALIQNKNFLLWILLGLVLVGTISFIWVKKTFMVNEYRLAVGQSIARESASSLPPGYTERIGTSVEGRAIYARYFGKGENTVLYTGGVHGNEEPSENIIGLWADYLSEHPEIIPEGTRVVVVERVNPDGCASDERFNANEMDINRNWDTDNWDDDIYVGGYLFPDAGGSVPFSEPESRALRDFVVEADVDLVVDYHCCVVGVYTGDEDGESARLAELMRKELGYEQAGEWTKSPVTGSFSGWMRTVRGVPAVTVEVEGGESFEKHLAALLIPLTF